MSGRAEDRPEYIYLRQFKKVKGWRLMGKYGAHSIGIGWKEVKGKNTDQLALVFYVAIKTQRPVKERIPPTFTFAPSGAEEPVELITDVVETPPAAFESERAKKRR